MTQMLELSHRGFKIAMIAALRDITRGSVVKNPPANARDSSLGREDPREKQREHTLVFLPGKSQGQRSLAGYSSRGRKRVGHDLATKQLY